ncbi:deoxyribodipyrimidine photo-lyase [Nocardioides sp.]|uniref:cryptochrome/photolyase family protein n=1 Tax=Nocardioides sp. TaxID=35761 RepID=UPI00273731A1|nr:deoxyribodipyrimidine photo-lyase [Nocardioides sp.]MDP3890023.1 deoxyribodipyrimidine photo-lyase [Nocardioides sp.]
MPTILWFRRDLRLADHPALLAACAGGTDDVLPLFVVDPRLWGAAGTPRRAYLAASLRDLRERLDGRLTLRTGDPVEVVPQVAREVEATAVHVTADCGPYGAARDRAVEEALGVPLVRTGSPYAVTPGRVLTQQGDPYRVFTPFLRSWAEHGWREPAGAPPDDQRWVGVAGEEIPAAEPPDGMRLPEAGEDAAHRQWQRFLDEAVADYPAGRDRPDREGTSRMSVPLKWGEIHPRTLLADLARLGAAEPGAAEAAGKVRAELAWREFHADVLHHHPDAARRHLRRDWDAMEYDAPGPAFDAWRRGETGFPIVDAGMRQLRETGWMHNRVRMIAASFLVKDLHLDWRLGARHFLQWLVDGDLASNQLNWQWVAGSGADAAPYFRVFNPTTQQKKFDPGGEYVRRWVTDVDRPGYPEPVVDHATERREALDRWEQIK